jgi:tripartite-type tricarboxylate transporter receptor subunit TctC
MQRRQLITAAAATTLAATFGTSPAAAQSAWPEGRNITMIVPFPPGGVADTVARPVAEAPWKTLAEFVADSKKKPGGYNYGSSGNYGTMHVPMEMLKASAGFPANHVPFTGAGPAVLALLGGQIDAVASGPSTVAQHIRAGKLRALGHWGDKSLQSLPEVPSLTQLGQPVKSRAPWAEAPRPLRWWRQCPGGWRPFQLRDAGGSA